MTRSNNSNGSSSSPFRQQRSASPHKGQTVQPSPTLTQTPPPTAPTPPLCSTSTPPQAPKRAAPLTQRTQVMASAGGWGVWAGGPPWALNRPHQQQRPHQHSRRHTHGQHTPRAPPAGKPRQGPPCSSASYMRSWEGRLVGTPRMGLALSTALQQRMPLPLCPQLGRGRGKRAPRRMRLGQRRGWRTLHRRRRQRLRCLRH